MLFNTNEIQQIVFQYYNLVVSVKNLPGEIDLNFQLKTAQKEVFNLKIANPQEEYAQLDFQNKLMERLDSKGFGLEIPKVITSQTREKIITITAPDGSTRLMRLLTWVHGRCLAEVNPHTPALMAQVGAMCGKLSKGLLKFEHPAAHRFLKWNPSEAVWTKDFFHKIKDNRKRLLVDYFFQLFEKEGVTRFPKLRKSIIYGDANDYNILVNDDSLNPKVPGVIDFGDAVYSHTINELAMALAYCAMKKNDPLATMAEVTNGYCTVFPLKAVEIAALYPMVIARLLISVTCSAINIEENPENKYLQISDQPAWDLLQKLRSIPPELIHVTLRHASGFEPSPKNAIFKEWAMDESRFLQQPHLKREAIGSKISVDFSLLPSPPTPKMGEYIVGNLRSIAQITSDLLPHLGVGGNSNIEPIASDLKEENIVASDLETFFQNNLELLVKTEQKSSKYLGYTPPRSLSKVEMLGSRGAEVNQDQTSIKNPSHQGNDLLWLDLSVGSPDLGTGADIADADTLHRRIADTMQNAGANIGLGRYDEARPFYTTDAYAVQGNEGLEWRTVHLGLDVFLPPGVPVLAPIGGKVHSFKDNASERDYGPTIILEHKISQKLTFYTLYGHLERKSLDKMKIGKRIKAGQAFCKIGPMPENGNWSPHLHFQVMLELLGNSGDFPGVAFHNQREVWTSLCPDPMLLLTGKPSLKPPQNLSAEEILKVRKAHLPKNLSISYQKPLNIKRGVGQFLYDETGRRFLDTVNNVAHVGHEHPRVVRAGQRQMAVLNTNTRYLHDNIALFSEALLETFPKELEVVFLVNSGSEANELAMRLAKNYTQQQDMLVIEIGYHGNTQGCVEVSSYKFDGPGGKGAPTHIHVMPMPDTFRGLYRANDNEAGLKYAAHIGQKINEIKANGRGIAAFLGESVISCGGQIPLPKGYLSAAYAQTRAAGGLCIADEVQTGCGRHGSFFWAFEEHGVVPDIVTIGKPIGNGHPLAAVVTTKKIADAFANGMEYFNTFGGNPVSCAIGLEVLRVIKDEKLQENALEIGNYLKDGLQKLAARFPIIGDVRGSGFFLGFELVEDRLTLQPAEAKTTYLANRIRELGVLMSTDGPFRNVIKIKPPMIFSRKDADFLLEMLEKVFLEDFMK
jgi:4-aminobutyrate aminotransferase-like enzyme/Ser/Thr protein kinase RdoA (MazF antagonist)